jgi:hypothetical protein
VIRPRPSFFVPTSLAAVLDWHRRCYPLLQGRDIYKLIHQGVFGPGHMIASAAAARRALATECRSQNGECRMQNSEEEGLLEPIDPERILVRVNLRPLQKEERRAKSEGRNRNQSEGDATDVEWLAEALVESARRVKGDPEQMKRRLTAAVGWCRTDFPLRAVELARIAVEAGAAGFPALHHSPAYKRAYAPAYRVVLSDCLKRPRVSGRAG